MQLNPKVYFIPPRPRRSLRVAVYARVSTNSMEQLNSLFAQVSGLTRLVVANPTWLLKDIYMDVASGKEKTRRPGFARMMADCTAHSIIKELETYRMHSPTGKERWSKKSVENVLSNEKYIGSVRLFDIRTHKAQYLSEDNHPPIITAEVLKLFNWKRTEEVI